MSKIICDVCGTRYPESAEQCPICGHVSAEEKKVESTEVESTYGREYSHTKGGHFSKANVKKRTAGAPIEEVPEEPEKPEKVEKPETTDEEEVVYEVPEKKKGGCFINFLLIVVILALLAVSAYIGLQYVAPDVLEKYNINLNLDVITQFLEGKTEAPATEATTEEPTTEEATEESTEEATTEEATIPCTDLVILDSLVMIDEVGQSYLLNAAVAPEDTTDTLMYISSDENIATVNGEGRVTAVAPGEVTITVSCGTFSVECKVLCAPGDITLPAPGTETEATEAAATTATEATTAPSTTEATSATEATTAPTKPVQLKDVKLSVKATDVTFVHRGQRATFKLTCGLANNEVTWTSQDESIITVDENGIATCVGYGTTNVIVSYGDQQVTILVRCVKE